MLGHILEPLKRILGKKSPVVDSKIQTFTYYIPAPPKRSTGYREKEFDKVFYHFINRGHEIIDIKTQAHNGPSGSGFWFICTVRTKAELLENLCFDLEEEEDELIQEELLYNADMELIREDKQ